MKQIGASWGCPNLFLGPSGEPEGTVREGEAGNGRSIITETDT